MKWLIIALAAAAALIGIGFVATGSRGEARLSRNPEAAALCEEGTADLHALRLRAAVEKLGRSLELDPALAEASISRTMAYARLGERQNLKREMARADSLTGLLKDDRRRLLAQLRLGAFPSSRFVSMFDSVYGVLEVQAPDNIYVLEAGAGRVALKQDDEATARAWQRILERDPNYANGYNMLGYHELKRGNFDLAIEYMQKYAFLAPELANPHDSLGDVYMVLGRYEEAEAEYHAAVKLQPDFYWSIINLGRVYLARGQMRRGVEILDALRTQVAGSQLEIDVDRAIINSFRRSDLDAELDAATARFIARYPDEKSTPVRRAIRLARLGRTDEGRAVMDSSLALIRADSAYARFDAVRRDTDGTVHLYDAMVADLAGDSRKAAVAWAAAIDRMSTIAGHEDIFLLKHRLASSLRDAGRAREALAVVDPVLAINPRRPEVLLLKARCHVELGEREAAVQALAQLERSLAKADAGLPILAAVSDLRAQLADPAAVQ